MKIELIIGDGQESFKINDEPVNEMDSDKLKIIAHNLVDKSDEEDLIGFIEDFVQFHSEPEDISEDCMYESNITHRWTWNDEDLPAK